MSVLLISRNRRFLTYSPPLAESASYFQSRTVTYWIFEKRIHQGKKEISLLTECQQFFS